MPATPALRGHADAVLRLSWAESDVGAAHFTLEQTVDPPQGGPRHFRRRRLNLDELAAGVRRATGARQDLADRGPVVAAVSIGPQLPPEACDESGRVVAPAG